MAKKSITQMTKQELIATIKEKNVIIADLNAKIDELEGMAVASSAIPLDSDASQIISSLKKQLEKYEGTA